MKRVLVTGGAGFIGTNVTQRLVQDGCEVTILDNLSRKGASRNLDWLSTHLARRFTFIEGDVRDRRAVEQALVGVDTVFHLAAQVAVTSSVIDPRSDFEINLVGTLNVLEEAKRSSNCPTIIFTSTNKVYGRMEDVRITESDGQYVYENLAHGVGESRNLDFHSPYGCSKGGADQYVHDYGRVYGLRTIVFRMSCIYGPHQFGNEDQGWVAHFAIRYLERKAINIYGNGKQVRDVLFVDDLVAAFKAAVACSDKFPQQVYNVGGGAGNTLSLLGLLKILEKYIGGKISLCFEDWRLGDQRIYISDIRHIARTTGWSPNVGAVEGVRRLLDWLKSNYPY
jgi:CDP-paratose 2-epimerase